MRKTLRIHQCDFNHKSVSAYYPWLWGFVGPTQELHSCRSCGCQTVYANYNLVAVVPACPYSDYEYRL